MDLELVTHLRRKLTVLHGHHGFVKTAYLFSLKTDIGLAPLAPSLLLTESKGIASSLGKGVITALDLLVPPVLRWQDVEGNSFVRTGRQFSVVNAVPARHDLPFGGVGKTESFAALHLRVSEDIEFSPAGSQSVEDRRSRNFDVIAFVGTGIMLTDRKARFKLNLIDLHFEIGRITIDCDRQVITGVDIGTAEYADAAQPGDTGEVNQSFDIILHECRAYFAAKELVGYKAGSTPTEVVDRCIRAGLDQRWALSPEYFRDALGESVADGVNMSQLAQRASVVFTPATPVGEADLFAGRGDQLEKVVGAINRSGQHVIIFGERGVGKTSLANVLHTKVGWTRSTPLPIKVSCDSTDNFVSLWQKIFSKIELEQTKQAPGFMRQLLKTSVKVGTLMEGNLAPHGVVSMLKVLARGYISILIIDEFDRLRDDDTRRSMADTVKLLSDEAVAATVVIVGVADSVDELLAKHQSVGRCLVQVLMPRMSREELGEILERGMLRLGLIMTGQAKRKIIALSQGLPHYVHLLALHSTKVCAEEGDVEVTVDHVAVAVRLALGEAQRSLQSAYHQAVASARRNSLYSHVLLACALARMDDLGYFRAVDISPPLARICGNRYVTSRYIRHLRQLCDRSRGPMLRQVGPKHNTLFRFEDPLVQPHIIMQGFVDGKIDAALLEEWLDARE